MQVLNIQDIEKKTNKKIRQNAVSVGVDIAEATTGVAILRTDKEKIYIENLQVIETSKKDDSFHRADNLVSSLEKLKQDIVAYKEYKLLIIEDCFFGQNAEVLKHLARFGILVYRELKKTVDVYYFMYPLTARSMIGFNQKKQQEKNTLKAEVYTRDTINKQGKVLHKKGEKKKIECKALVHNYLETAFGLVFDSPDKADGFVLALAGLLK